MEERNDRREQDKDKEGRIIISTRERNETQSGIMLGIRASPNHSCIY